MESFNLDILIVEDSLSFALELEMLLEELNYNVIARVDNAAEALEAVYSKSPDLIFMDIEIKGSMSGVEIGQKVSHLNIPILFISSKNDEKMYQAASESNMIGYLVKPVEKISLRTAIKLAIAQAYAIKKDQTSDTKVMTKEEENNIITDDCFFFKKRDTFHKVKIKDIAFIRSDDNYCEVNTINNSTFTARITMNKLEAMLAKDLFIRTHRQYLVQRDLIDIIDFNDSILKIMGKTIPVSRTKRKELAEIFRMIK